MTPRRSSAPRILIALALALALLAAACGDDDDSSDGAEAAGATEPAPAGDDGELRKLTITTPTASFNNFPIDVALALGYFEDEGFDVELVTLTGPAAGHVSAVLSGDAWGFVGGVEHVMIANARGAELRTVVALTQMSGQYLVAAEEVDFDADPAAALRGKRIAVSAAGLSPNVAARSYLESLGLDPDQDVTLVEGDSGARLAAVAGGQADMAFMSEPNLTQGQQQGVWGEPVFELSQHRPNIHNAVNVPLATIEEQPEVVEAFIRAVVRAEQTIYDDPDLALEVLREANPDLDLEVLEPALQRGLRDRQWSPDGRFADGAVEAVGELAASLVEEGEIDAPGTFDLRYLPEG